jgi:hypothetical protein
MMNSEPGEIPTGSVTRCTFLTDQSLICYNIPSDASKVLHKPMSIASQIFTRCEDYLEKLVQYFCERDQSHPRRHFLLYGMGGVGKTQICLKFLEDHPDW